MNNFTSKKRPVSSALFVFCLIIVGALAAAPFFTAFAQNENNPSDYWVFGFPPDFTIRDPILRMHRGSLHLTFRVFNAGGATRQWQPSLNVYFEWLNSNGQVLSAMYDSPIAHASGEDAWAAFKNQSTALVYYLESSQRTYNFVVNPPNGATQLRLTVDRDNAYEEIEGETNNSVVLERPTPPDRTALLPDLAISDLHFDNGLFVSITNTGLRDAEGQINAAVQWADQRNNSIGNPLILSAGARVAQGAQFVFSPREQSALFEYSVAPPAGASKIIVTADPNATAREQDEWNNDREIPGLPDFIIDNLEFIPEGLSYRIRNIGAATAFRDADNRSPLEISIRWYDRNGNHVDSATPRRFYDAGVENGVQPGFSRTVLASDPIIIDPPYGASKLRVEIDETHSRPEIREDNNRKEIERLPRDTATQLPDLRFRYATVTDRNFIVKFVNQGNADINTSVPVEINLQWLNTAGETLVAPIKHTIRLPRDLRPSNGGVILDTRSPAPNTTSTIWMVVNDAAVRDYLMTNAPRGERQLLIRIDPENKIRELNEKNNDGNEVVGTPAIAGAAGDLTVDISTWTDSGVRYRVSNIGDSPIYRETAIVVIARWIGENERTISEEREVFDDPEVRQVVNSGFSRVIERNENFFRRPPEEALEMRLIVDADNVIPEQREDNNQSVVARLPGKPNLVLDIVQFTADFLDFTVRNDGLRPALPSIPVRLEWIDNEGEITGQPFMFYYQNELVSGASFSIHSPSYPDLAQWTVNPPPNTHHVRVTADPNNEFNEAREYDNVWEEIMLEPDTEAENLVKADENAAAEDISFDLRGEGGETNEKQEEKEKTAEDNNKLPFSEDAETNLGESETGDAEENAAAQTGETDDNETPPRENAYNPIVLPGNPLYIFKTFGRFVRSALTFNKKAEVLLELEYANKKLIEANILADKGKTSRAIKNLEGFSENMREAAELVKELTDSKQEDASDAAKSILRSGLRQQVVLGKISRLASEEDKQIVTKVRETVAQKIGETTSAIKQDGEITEIVEETVRAGRSQMRDLYNAEALNAIADSAPPKAKTVISRAEENLANRLADTIAESPANYASVMPAYIENAGGETIRYLEMLSYSALDNVAEKNRHIVEEAKQKIFAKVEAELEKNEGTADKTDLTPAVLKPLITGEIKEIRVLDALKANIKSEFDDEINAAKEQAMDKFAEKIKSADETTALELAKNIAGQLNDRENITIFKEAETKISSVDQNKLAALKEEISGQMKLLPSPVQLPANFLEPPKITALPAPIICAKEYKPVCGIDGKTYSNRCAAEQENKMKIVYEEECATAPDAKILPVETPAAPPAITPSVPSVPKITAPEIPPILETPILKTPVPEAPSAIEIPLVPVETPKIISPEAETPIAPIQVLPITIVEPKADLTVTEFIYSPSSLTAGDSVNFSAKILNQGKKPADSSFIRICVDNAVCLTSADKQLSIQGVSSLEIAGTQSFNAVWTAAEGNHTIYWCADVGGHVAESKEDNNCSHLFLTVAAAKTTAPAFPDLLTTLYPLPNTQLISGQVIIFSGSVSNQGQADAGSFSGRFCVDNPNCLASALGQLSAPAAESLAAGKITPTYFANWTSAEGIHTIYFCADIGKNITESNENNNCSSINFTVVKPAPILPDLVVEKIEYPSGLVSGAKLTVSAKISSFITNSTMPFAADLMIDGVKKGTVNVVAVSFDASYTAKWTDIWTATIGSHKIEVCVNSNKSASEANYSNNCAYSGFSVSK